jgi:hypothetical protein
VLACTAALQATRWAVGALVSMNALAVNGGMTRELNRPIFLYGVDRQGVGSMLGQRRLD